MRCNKCELIDFVAPTAITTGNATTYGCILVSIKSWLYFPPKPAKELCVSMKQKVMAWNLKSAPCIVCIFGQTKESDDAIDKYDASMLSKLADGENVAIVLRLPREDRFGVTDSFLEMAAVTDGCVVSLLLCARIKKLTAKNALRSSARNSVDETFRRLMDSLHR
jgi:hypothetical protein